MRPPEPAHTERCPRPSCLFVDPGLFHCPHRGLERFILSDPLFKFGSGTLQRGLFKKFKVFVELNTFLLLICTIKFYLYFCCPIKRFYLIKDKRRFTGKTT